MSCRVLLMTTRSWQGLCLIQYPVPPPVFVLFYGYSPLLFQPGRNIHKRIPAVPNLLKDSLMPCEVLRIFLQPSSSLLSFRCTSLLFPMRRAYSDTGLVIDLIDVMHHPFCLH